MSTLKIMKLVIIVLVLFILFSVSFAIDFTSTEIMVIPWGDGVNELMKGSLAFEDPNVTPGDTTDDIIFPYWCLQDGFVDKYENIYFSSSECNYLKGFNSSGELIVNFSGGISDNDSTIYFESSRDIYIDSLIQIYILGSNRPTFIAVLDTAYNLIDTLRPNGIADSIELGRMYHSSDDVLSILCLDKTFYTYKNEIFFEGGSSGWRAVNGKYYVAFVGETGFSIKFKSFTNPDIYGNANDLQYYQLPYPDELHLVKFLGVDDSMYQLIYLIKRFSMDHIVQVYDTLYTLVNEIVPESRENWYDMHIYPFMRPDGNVYEFRCLEDGLHVIRWAKEE